MSFDLEKLFNKWHLEEGKHYDNCEMSTAKHLLRFLMLRYSQEDHVDQLAQELYSKKNHQFTPAYPWVAVRVCIRAQELNGIVLPDSGQNKTVHEGIVLATWKDCVRPINGKPVAMLSDFKPGDHVLFNHFAGVPLDGVPGTTPYRLVKEHYATTEGGLLGKIEYDALHTRPVEKLKRLIETEVYGLRFCTSEIADFVSDIDAQFLLVDRDTPSVTISGR